MNILLLIFFLIFFGNIKKDRRKSDLFRVIFGIYIAVTVLGTIIPSPFFWIAAALLILFTATSSKKDNKTAKDPEKNRYAERESYSAGRRESGILPKPIGRRNRIISQFNEKYQLSLTEEEISRIAEASYVSEGWRHEVEDMTTRYETEGQWFQGPTGWLRVYIYAFEVQNISSDFTMQEQICFEALDEVMAYACSFPAAAIEERIQRLNDRYFTRFNEMSFMIAYRFLQRKGRTYDLSRPDLVRNVDQELEKTMKKYKTGVKE